MIPSTIPAKPYRTPARIASTVDLPISARGGVRSIVGSAAARSDSASSEISTPGKITPPRYSPPARDDVVGDRGAEVDDHAGAADALVAGDGVDEPVRADLARVVVADRHPGLQARADQQHLVAEVAARHRRPLGPQLRDRRGDDRGVDVGEREPAQREQVAQRGAELVGGRLAHGGEAPVVRPARRRRRRRGGSACCRRRRRAASLRPHVERRPGAAHVLARRARASASAARPAPGHVAGRGSSSSSGTSTKRRDVTSRCGSVSRSDAYVADRRAAAGRRRSAAARA